MEAVKLIQMVVVWINVIWQLPHEYNAHLQILAQLLEPQLLQYSLYAVRLESAKMTVELVAGINLAWIVQTPQGNCNPALLV